MSALVLIILVYPKLNHAFLQINVFKVLAARIITIVLFLISYFITNFNNKVIFNAKIQFIVHNFKKSLFRNNIDIVTHSTILIVT